MKKGFAAAPVGTMLVAFSIREWRRQAVLFEAIDRGIFLYASKDGVSASLSIVDDLFVPWERVEDMRYLGWGQPRAVRSGLAGGRWPVVVVNVEPTRTGHRRAKCGVIS